MPENLAIDLQEINRVLMGERQTEMICSENFHTTVKILANSINSISYLCMNPQNSAQCSVHKSHINICWMTEWSELRSLTVLSELHLLFTDNGLRSKANVSISFIWINLGTSQNYSDHIIYHSNLNDFVRQRVAINKCIRKTGRN